MSSIAILTGATGGLGASFIEELLKESLDEIWAIGRNKEKLDNLKNKYGDIIYPIVMDLSDEDSIKEIKGLLRDKKPDVKFLINNAGMAMMSKIESISTDEISNMIDINCKTPTLLCQYVIPYMNRGGRILNISSASSFQPNPYITLYSATKVYLRSYSRSLNYELKDKKITCTAVCPGWIDTDMIKKEYNGKKVKFPGLVSPKRVAHKAIKDSKRGKDMSVCSLFVKYEHLLSKIFPQKWAIRLWGRSVKKYVE